MKSKSPLFIAFLVVLIDLIGFGMLIPIQPFYAESLGASATTVTLLGATYSAMQFLFAPMWGFISDKYGRRPVVLWSVFLTGIGHLLFGLSTGLFTLFFARALAGFGAANISAVQAIISDTTTPENRARGMGMIGAAFGLGFILGPAFGWILQHYGLSAPAFGAAIFCTFNFIFALFLLPETKKVDSAPAELGFFQKIAALKNVDIVIKELLMLTLIVTTAFAMMEQCVGLFIEHIWDRDAGPSMTATFLVFVGITATFVQGFLVGKLAKRFGETAIVPIALIILALGLFCIPLFGSTEIKALFWLSGPVIAFGSGLFSPNVWSIISKKSDLNSQGLNLSLNQSSAALGRIFGPAAAGILFEAHPNGPFVIGGLCVLGSLLVYKMISRKYAISGN